MSVRLCELCTRHVKVIAGQLGLLTPSPDRTGAGQKAREAAFGTRIPTPFEPGSKLCKIRGRYVGVM